MNDKLFNGAEFNNSDLATTVVGAARHFRATLTLASPPVIKIPAERQYTTVRND